MFRWKYKPVPSNYYAAMSILKLMNRNQTFLHSYLKPTGK